MKKLLLSLLMILGVGLSANAQIIGATNNQQIPQSPNSHKWSNAIGLSWGKDIIYSDFVGGEDSYCIGLTSIWHAGTHQIEVDIVRFGNRLQDSWGLVGTYQWTGAFSRKLGWFVGAGGRIGSGYYDYGYYYEYYHTWDADEISFDIIGQVGISYTPPTYPLQFSFEIRPRLTITPDQTAGFGSDICIGARYRF